MNYKTGNAFPLQICGRSRIRTCTGDASNRCSSIGAIRPSSLPDIHDLHPISSSSNWDTRIFTDDVAESEGIEPSYPTRSDSQSLAGLHITSLSTLPVCVAGFEPSLHHSTKSLSSAPQTRTENLPFMKYFLYLIILSHNKKPGLIRPGQLR